MYQCQELQRIDPLSMTLFCLTKMPLLDEANQRMQATPGDVSTPGAIKAYANDWHPVGTS